MTMSKTQMWWLFGGVVGVFALVIVVLSVLLVSKPNGMAATEGDRVYNASHYETYTNVPLMNYDYEAAAVEKKVSEPAPVPQYSELPKEFNDEAAPSVLGQLPPIDESKVPAGMIAVLAVDLSGNQIPGENGYPVMGIIQETSVPAEYADWPRGSFGVVKKDGKFVRHQGKLVFLVLKKPEIQKKPTKLAGATCRPSGCP